MVRYMIGPGTATDLQKMGVVTANNKQDVYIQGWNIGVEMNR